MRKEFIYLFIIAGFFLFLVLLTTFFPKSSPDNEQTHPSPLPSSTSNNNLPASPIPFSAETDNYKTIEVLKKEKSWIDQVPIVTDNFITRYDYETDSIEIVVYTQEGRIKYTQKDVSEIKRYVEETLSKRGIDIKSVKITARVE